MARFIEFKAFLSDTVSEREGDQLKFFEIAPGRAPLRFKPLREKVWTESKAEIIRNYLSTFQLVTKHGVYLDGFAGMFDRPENWAANLVLGLEPCWLGPFHLFDVNNEKTKDLKALAEQHADKDVRVVEGDFNREVGPLLASGAIGPRRATFALLDQYTFECHWSTVAALASHPKDRYKIEQFYFLANGWFDRAIAGLGNDRGSLWWGRSDWKELRDLSGPQRAQLMAERFVDELGYEHAVPWPIYDRKDGGRIAYYMIHATDHPAAVRLMTAAYEKRIPPPEETMQMFDPDDYADDSSKTTDV